MAKSATEVMQEILFAAVVDAIVALKASSKGVPNTLLRDLNAVHANTAFADLPEGLQSTIPASVRAAFTRLLKEGYSVSPGRGAAPPPPPRREHAPRPSRPGQGAPRGDGPRPPRGDGPRPPRGDGRPRGPGGPPGNGPGGPAGRPGRGRSDPGGRRGPGKG
jgi:hypothetical protein